MLICTAAGIILLRRIKDRRRALLLHKLCALAVALLLIFHVVFGVAGLREYQRSVAAISFSNTPISAVRDGDYTGECDAGYIYAKVRVTVRQGAITDIDLLAHRNERGKAGEGVVDEILSEQRIDVDAVSGATNSSKVIKKAIENAIAQGIDPQGCFLKPN